MVNITSITFFDEYTGPYGSDTSNTDHSGVTYLEGCVGDRVYVVVEGNVAWSSAPSGTNFSGNTIVRTDCGGTGSFVADGWQVGDIANITGTSLNNGNVNVTSITASTLTVSQTLTTESSATALLQGATPVEQLDFSYNMIPSAGANSANSGSFNSLSDVSYSQTISFYPGSPGVVVYQQRSLAWVDTDPIDSFSPECFFPFGHTTPNKNFTIIMLMYVKPFSLSNQLPVFQNVLSGGALAPTYFLNGQNLSFVCEVDAIFNEGSTAVGQSTTTTNNESSTLLLQGKTYWFNEPTVPPGITAQSLPWYSLDSITYYDTSTSSTIDTIDIGAVTDVTVTITPNSGISLSNGDPFVLNIARMSTNQSDYQNIKLDPYNKADTTDYRKAMLHDRCFTKVNAASKNGDFHGTNYQQLQNVTSSIVAGNLVINFQVSASSDILNTITKNLGGDSWYMIWVTPQPQSITSLQYAERTAVLCDVQQFQLNTAEPTAFNILPVGSPAVDNIEFFQFPNVNSNGTSNSVGYAGDYAYALCDFNIAQGYSLQNCTVNVQNVVTDPSGNVNTYNITSYAFNTASYATSHFAGNISINNSGNYALPGSLNGQVYPYNIRSINRASQFDTTGYYAYTLNYAFQYGYQYWQNVTTYAPIFQQYHTQYWPVYTSGQYQVNGPNVIPVGYTSSLQFQVIWNVQNIATGNITQFIRNCDIAAYDNLNNVTMTSPAETIISMQTFDQFGNNLNGIISYDVPTVIQITCEGTDIAIPPLGYTQLVGTLTFAYNNRSQQIYDRTDSVIGNLVGSFWTTPCYVQVIDTSPADSVVVLQATIDLSTSPTAISGTVTGTLTYSA